MIFSRARAEAPCVLILEDLDSLITDMNRSFFLNEVDGLEDNDGLLLVSAARTGAIQAEAGRRSRWQVERFTRSVESSRVECGRVWWSIGSSSSPSLTRQIGTTNHFDKLDPALSNRPSRFDRK